MRWFPPSPAVFRVVCLLMVAMTLWSTSLPGSEAAELPAFSAAPFTDDRFGLVFVNAPGLNVPEVRYQQAYASGARWTRWPFYWHHIETAPGKLDDAAYAQQDAVVARDRAAGLEINGILVGTPNWAASGGTPTLRTLELGASLRLLGVDRAMRTQDVGAVTTPPRNLQAPIFLPNGEINPENYWARFVYTTASRYRGKVAVWEIWNEPDLKDGSRSGVYWNGTDEDYLWLLKVAYFAIRKADPSARVSFAGLAYWTDPSFLPRLLDLIARDPGARANSHFFDLVSLHLYTNPNHLYNIPVALRAELAKRGLSKPIWVNEANLPLCDDKQVDPALFCPSLYRGTMADQASFVIKAYALALAAGVERVFIFQFYDDDVGPHDWYGLVRNNGTVRPAYRAYQTAGRYLSWATRAEKDVFGRSDAVVVRGTPFGKITVLWARSTRNDVAKVVAQSAAAKLVDSQGNERTIAPYDGAYLVPLPGGNPDNGGGEVVMLIEPVAVGVASRVNALPPQTMTLSFPVSWTAVGETVPGVRFDVDFRQGPQGRWTRWLTNTEATTAVFGEPTGVTVWPGQQYSFRVRARLPNGDAEPVHEGDGDAMTVVASTAR